MFALGSEGFMRTRVGEGREVNWWRHGGKTVGVTEREWRFESYIDAHPCIPDLFCWWIWNLARMGKGIWQKKKIRDVGDQSGRWEPPLWR